MKRSLRALRYSIFFQEAQDLVGDGRTYVNLLITMLLGGLWHGASWNFVIWGGVHGAALVVNRFWGRHVKVEATTIGRILGWATTFLFVCVVWVLFRAPDTATMVAMYSKMLFVNAAGVNWYYEWFFVAAALMVVGHVIGIYRDRAGEEELVFFDSPYSFKAAFSMTAVLLLIYLFAPTNTNPFIYFQF